MSADARPTPPSTYVTFDGADAHVEEPSSAGMSVGSLGLTIAVWMRPNSLAFVNTEGSLASQRYVY
jgi:DMSO/TMAO reductase YedYZ molybdopterin-dependent catalytic subunit